MTAHVGVNNECIYCEETVIRRGTPLPSRSELASLHELSVSKRHTITHTVAIISHASDNTVISLSIPSL